MKKIAFLFLIILFLFPILGEATCCEKKQDGETVECNGNFSSANECANWAGALSSWSPTVDSCDYITNCTDLTGEEVFASSPEYLLEVPLGTTTSITGFNEYIKIIYRFGIGLIALIALFLIVFNGVNWILAGGNDQRIGEAKKGIIGAVIGLIIALSSFLILNTINPKLVSLDEMQVPLIQLQEVLSGTIEPCYKTFIGQDPYEDSYTTPSGRVVDLNTACEDAANAYGISPAFIKAIIGVETSWGRNIGPSECGAYGISQFMPSSAMNKFPTDAPTECSTYNDLGANACDCRSCEEFLPACQTWIAENPERMIFMSAQKISEELRLSYIHGDYALAAAAYNAGIGNVQQAGGIPNIEETINYVNRTKQYHDTICDSPDTLPCPCENIPFSCGVAAVPCCDINTKQGDCGPYPVTVDEPRGDYACRICQ